MSICSVKEHKTHRFVRKDRAVTYDADRVHRLHFDCAYTQYPPAGRHVCGAFLIQIDNSTESSELFCILGIVLCTTWHKEFIGRSFSTWDFAGYPKTAILGMGVGSRDQSAFSLFYVIFASKLLFLQESRGVFSAKVALFYLFFSVCLHGAGAKMICVD
jgi:hypothetical protein